MTVGDPLAIIGTIRADIERTAEVLLASAERSLLDVRAAKAGEAEAFERIEASLCAILEACTFQDLVGQRLSQLQAALGLGEAATLQLDGGLLNGPAAAGKGLDQSEVDALMTLGET